MRDPKVFSVVFTTIVGAIILIGTGLQFRADERDQNRDHNDAVAIYSCVHNPAYVGVTAEDTQQLFFQCVADFKSAH